MDGNTVTLVVTLVIWIGIFGFLLRLDKKVKNLEKRQS